MVTTHMMHLNYLINIGRTFGALRAQFLILMDVKLMVAVCALHNYIHMNKPYDWIFKMCEKDASFTMEKSLPH